MMMISKKRIQHSHAKCPFSSLEIQLSEFEWRFFPSRMSQVWWFLSKSSQLDHNPKFNTLYNTILAHLNSFYIILKFKFLYFLNLIQFIVCSNSNNWMIWNGNVVFMSFKRNEKSSFFVHVNRKKGKWNENVPKICYVLIFFIWLHLSSISILVDYDETKKNNMKMKKISIMNLKLLAEHISLDYINNYTLYLYTYWYFWECE